MNESKTKYTEITHDEVITAVEASKVRKDITLKEGAKSLILKVKGKGIERFVNVIVCGDAKFENKLLRRILNVSDISFASPADVELITDGVKPGGVPPFGNLFGLEVIADENILKNEQIAFSAGSRYKTIVMSITDWKNLVTPKFYQLY